MAQLIRAMIVDDSAFTRKVVKEILVRSPHIDVVGFARDGLEALEMAAELKPDVITCDLTMPRLGGVEFIRQQMARRPVPILLLSVANQNAESVLQALEAGAVDFVQKPTALANDRLFDIRDELLRKVKTAAEANGQHLLAATEAQSPSVAKIAQAPFIASRVSAVVIGVSTGGPQALRSLLPALPGSFPVPIAMVLHMPPGFTRLYAAKLNEICQLHVKEAEAGDMMRPGLALLAPAGIHMVLRKTPDGDIVTTLALEPASALHRPSADVLFQSAANAYGERLLGVVMTGMGSDGKEGAAWIKAQGGAIITEAESSCVIYGMPRAVAEAGLSDAAVPLERLPQAIMERL